MWAFFDFGLLMPALVPAKHANDAAVLEWTNNGEYELQVRGRLREHLEYFMRVYMEPGTFNPNIQATPDKDYNFRFYTTREAYAEGIKQAALKMDYEKFKVTSDRYQWNTKYHSVLNTVWSDVCRLNEPGGFYGPRSADNPHGYDTAKRYSSWGGTYDYASAHDARTGSSIARRVGDSFGPRDTNSMAWYDEEWDDAFSNVDLGNNENWIETEDGQWVMSEDARQEWGFDADGNHVPMSSPDAVYTDEDRTAFMHDMDYTPDSEVRKQRIIDEMEQAGIDPSDWQETLMEHEWALVKNDVEALLSAPTTRRAFRRSRQNTKVYSD